MNYQDMCFTCGEKTYGKPKRDLGAITVSARTCPVCKTKEVAVVPGRDWYYIHEPYVTTEDWD